MQLTLEPADRSDNRQTPEFGNLYAPSVLMMCELFNALIPELA
jgi:hypothetical protein